MLSSPWGGSLAGGLREAGEHRLEVFEVPLDRLRHGVGAGEDLPAVAAPGGEVAGDPLQLLDDIPGCTPDRSAREARRPIASDCDAAQPPAFPIWLKHLEDSLLVPVDRDVELSAAGLDLLRDADQGVGPRARGDERSGPETGSGSLSCAPAFAFTRRCSGPARRGSCPIDG